MTDNTLPEALRLADALEYCDASVARQAINELRRQHARISELEAQLEAVGAGGVSGPLMGRTDSKERAGRFTKKPVTIDAWLIDFGNKPLPDWVNEAFRTEAIDWCPSGEGLYINTLEGHMLGANGSWLIKGVQGELYACKPDIFAATYERASLAASPPAEQQAQPGAVDRTGCTAMLAASPTPPTEQPIGELVVTKTKDGQIISVTRQDDEGRILSVIATSDPEEQQATATDGYVQPVPDKCDRIIWRGRYYHLPLTEQAAPKAAPVLPEGWTACTIEFGNDGPEEVAYGPQRMMNRLAKWLGKYFARVIADAAPKAAPVSSDTLYLLRRLLSNQHTLTGPEFRAELGKIVGEAYQQEAQEPVGWTTGITWRPNTRLQSEQVIKITRDAQPMYGYTTPLYTAPQPAPAPLSDTEKAVRQERERICAAIKAEDDYCVDQGDYMLDSNDCIKIVKGEWVRPDFSAKAALAAHGDTP